MHIGNCCNSHAHTTHRLKIADNTDLWKLKAKHEFEKKQPRTQAEETNNVEFSVRNRSYVRLLCTDYTVNNGEH